MKQTDVLIIGAGATGLMAARELAKAGKQVIILEARNSTGGRIHTLTHTAGFSHAELGAEFVHGDLPVSLQLLKEAGIKALPASGEMWHFQNGEFLKEYQQDDNWSLLMQKLNKLESDISIGEFLQNEFGSHEYAGLRTSVCKFVAGYDTADASRASSLALREEWQNEDEGAQHRVKGGYGLMIGYLVSECRQHGAQLFLNAVVKKINWGNRQVEVTTAGGDIYKAEKIIIALPLGVLKVDLPAASAVMFSPAIPAYREAIQKMGFGAIIKVLLEFKTAFWENEETKKLADADLKEMSFILSDEEVPTWWTQFPEHSAVLTGWLGGPNAEKKKDLTDEELLERSLQSLSNIFKRSPDTLRGELVAWRVVNWTADPFTLGSYAYDTVDAHEVRKVLGNPINHTIYFAGEYLYEGPAMGTVEAALTSGLETARKIIG